MLRLRMLFLALALGLFTCGAFAGDGDKPEKQKSEKVAKEEKEKKEKSEKRGGNAFVNFWVHTVGGTIGNGLKTGARKIEKGFD